MKINRLLITALAASVCFGGAASIYAFRARDSAVRAWAVATQRGEELVQSQQYAKTEWAAAKKLREELELRTTLGGHRIMQDLPQSYRQLWNVMLGTAPESDLEFVTALADYIHSHVPLGGADLPGSVPERMTNALQKKGEQAICGDLSLFLNHAIMASGITSRTVQLAADTYINGEAIGDTHVTVEVLLDDRWTIVDPTFDATFSCGDDTKLLGIVEARACVAEGKKLSPHYGENVLNGRKVKDYYLPYEKLISNYLLSSTRKGDKFFDTEYHPEKGWIEKTIEKYYTTPKPKADKASFRPASALDQKKQAVLSSNTLQ